jgi:biopolymer transport protein ExbD
MVIIVSLIDVLIVVLIFLMVTTTFKQQSSLKLVLPKSSQAQTGASANREFIVAISKSGLLSFTNDPVRLDQLQQRLKETAEMYPNMTLVIRADTNAPWGRVVEVRDAASEAKIKNVNAAVDKRPAP